MMLSYKQYGKGYPIVLLHAFPLDSEMWFPQVPLLERYFQLILPDLPGLGDSQIVEENQSIEDIAYKVLELLDHLQIKKAVIGGLSMGGYVTFNLYRISPEIFQALILLDTSPFADTSEKRKVRFELIEHIKLKGSTALVEKLLPNLVSKDVDFQLLNWLKKKFFQAKPENLISLLKALANRQDHCHLLPKIHVPTLLIFGENDAVTNVETAMEMQRQIPNSKLFEVPNAGHYSNLENPDAFNQFLMEFLEENKSLWK